MSIHRLAAHLSPASSGTTGAPPAPPRHTRGTVMAINADGSLGIQVDGDTTQTVPADCMETYVPTVGDTVEVTQFGGRQLVTGILASASGLWTAVTLLGNWLTYAGGQPPQVRVLNNKVIYRGMIANANAAGSSQNICNLPVSPGYTQYPTSSLHISGADTQTPMQVSSGGTLSIKFASSVPVTWLSLAGLEYWTD